MQLTTLTLAVLAFGSYQARQTGAVPPEVEIFERRAAALRPKPSETRWQSIPWLTELPEAVRTADAEQRPVLVWSTGDAPLERC